MLAALVEKWRLEIYTFVKLVGEVAMTLEDVLHLFSLLIDREVVTGWTDSSHDFLVAQSLMIFGSEPQVSSSSKSYVRCNIFYLLGTTHFANKSTTSLCRATWYDCKEIMAQLICCLLGVGAYVVAGAHSLTPA
ncbi:hypothetical protein AHAS_Ahas19G0134900 [Arachis hypogaea]